MVQLMVGMVQLELMVGSSGTTDGRHGATDGRHGATDGRHGATDGRRTTAAYCR